MKHLVSTDWLKNNLNNVKILDASWHLPGSNRNGFAEFKEKHIKNANFFDIDKNSDQQSSLPHMLPKINDWEKIMSAHGVKNSDHVIIYDNSDVISSCRVWYNFLYFNHNPDLVSVLDGGFKKWLMEKKEITMGTPCGMHPRIHCLWMQSQGELVHQGRMANSGCLSHPHPFHARGVGTVLHDTRQSKIH